MKPDRQARVRNLLDHALKLDPSERAPFVAQVCGGDASLRGEVERILADAGNPPGDVFPTLPFEPDRPPLALPLDPLTGKRIGPYLIKRLIGSGGMGSVYLAARVDDFQNEVALKLVRRGLDTEEFVQRFRSERQVLAGLNHPHIARLLDGGTTDDGLPYLVMEYIDGQPIDRYCESRQLPTRERVQILRAVCAAVHHAHQHTVIHRDLKPGNVLLTAEGTPKVVDFGLAKRVEGGPLDTPHSLTATGAVVGTPSYMAPEQAQGKSGTVGPAADVYAVGAILYELLTGRPPFRAETPLDTLLQVLHEEPVPPGRLHAHLPRDLETICLKCLHKDPARRYASALALDEDLGRFLAGESILARPVGRAERFGRWCRRHPGVAGLTAAVAVLLVAVVVGALLTARREQRLRADTEQANADLETALYSRSIAVADLELTLRNDVGLAEELLDLCPASLRGWEWHYMRRRLDGGRPPLTGHAAGVWSVAFSPDGKRLASGSIDGTVKVWDAATGRLLRTFQGHLPAMAALLPDNLFPVMCVAFSPDGRHVASGSHELQLTDLRNPTGIVKIWDADTGKEVRSYRGHRRLVIGLAFRPDGKQVASSGLDNTVQLWDPATGNTKHVLRGHADWVNRVSYSPDGRRLASPSMDGTIKLWDTTTGREVGSFDGRGGPVRDAEFSRDGRWLASASMDGAVTLWDAATGRVRQALRGHSGSAFGVGFSPDGRRLASAGFDKTVRVWDVATGKETITLRGHGDLVWSVAFSPDGRRLASGSWDKTVRVWDATPVEEPSGAKTLTLVGHSDRVNRVAFSPDGRRVATAGWDNLVRVWDADAGTELFALKGHTSGVISVAFSPDQQRIVTGSWDRTARVWDAATGRELLTFRGHRTLVHGVAFSPDSRSVASTCADGTVKVWDAATGAERYTLRAHLLLAYCVAFSPDGMLLATAGGDRVIKIFDARTGRERRTLRGHGMVVYDVAFSPDGRQVVSASWDQTLRRWDVATGKPLGVYRGHQDHVHAVAFSPDGTRLVSASEDKTVRIWDVATCRQIGPPRAHRGAVWSVAVSPDGRRVASACWYPKGWVKIWPMPP